MIKVISRVIALSIIAGISVLLPHLIQNASHPTHSENLELEEIGVPSPGLQRKSEEHPSEDTPCAHLAQDTEFRPALNGTKIPIPLEKANITGVKIQPIRGGGLLVMTGDTLYRLDAEKRIVWKYTEAQFMFDFALVPATGLIYGTAGDGVMFILNAATGKKLLRDAYMGKGAYGVVRAYRKDECLVTSDFAMYREDWKSINPKTIEEVMSDEVTAFRGTKALWTKPFPPDADLVVDGERILAVTKTVSSIYVKEISAPTKRIAR